MRTARAAVSVFVLLAIVLGAPGVVRAYRADPMCATTACDSDLDAPFGIETPSAAVVAVIRSCTVIASAPTVTFVAVRCEAILSTAPKTSPPSDRSLP